MKKFIASFLFAALSCICFAQVKISEKTEKVNGKKYYLHTVQEDETAEAIMQAYSVSAETLLAENPFLKNGIHAGQVLRIPFPEKEKKKKDSKELQSMGDVLGSNNFLLGKGIVSGNFTYTLGRMVFDEGGLVRKEFRNTLGASVKIKLFEEVSLNGSFYKHLNPNAYQKWTADFFYSLKRFNWRPNTFSYGYENYSNNRYSDDAQDILDKMKLGYFFLSYQHNLPEKRRKKILLDETTNISFSYLARFSPYYFDNEQNILGGWDKGKTTFGMSARYTIVNNIFIEGAVYYYLNKSQQLPWDPDFTYGFGYFNWKAFKFSFSYGNWVINRFEGKNPYHPSYSFADGDFTVTFNWVW